VGLQQLTAPLHDADDLADILADPSIGGFKVTKLINQPNRTVGEAIGDFYAEARPNDLTLLYFSGHGLKDDSGKLYLAMKDTRLRNKLWTSLTADQINQSLSDSASKQKIVILDCCYAGAFPFGTVTKADDSVHVAEKIGGGRILLTASDATQYAFEGDRLKGGEAPRSVFTQHLIAGLRDGSADTNLDGDITVDELYEYVCQKVIEERPQQRPKMDGSRWGSTVVAQNVNWSLPPFIESGLRNPWVSGRLDALEALDTYFRNGNHTVRRKIHETVKALRDDDDSRSVQNAAGAWLATHPVNSGSQPVDVDVHPGPPTAAPKDQPTPAALLRKANQQELPVPQPEQPPKLPTPKPVHLEGPSAPDRRGETAAAQSHPSSPAAQSQGRSQDPSDSPPEDYGRIDDQRTTPIDRHSSPQGVSRKNDSHRRRGEVSNFSSRQPPASPESSTLSAAELLESGGEGSQAIPPPARSGGLSRRTVERNRMWYHYPAVWAIAASAAVFLVTVLLTVWPKDSGLTGYITSTTSPPPPAVTATPTWTFEPSTEVPTPSPTEPITTASDAPTPAPPTSLPPAPSPVPSVTTSFPS
jgi:hypothetical protein